MLLPRLNSLRHLSSLLLPKQIAVCIPMGGYSGETFSSERLYWFSLVIEDLNSQIRQPDEVVVSINGNVNSNTLEAINNLLSHVKAPLSVSNCRYTLSAEENFRRAVLGSQSTYFSWWSDHDRHSPDFLSSLLQIHETVPGTALVSSMLGHINDNDEVIMDFTNQCEPLAVTYLDPSERVLKLTNSKLIGAVYGLFDRAIYEQVARPYNCLGPDLMLTYAIAMYGNVFILPEAHWSERTRERRILDASVRHAEFYDSCALVPGNKFSITHHLIYFTRVVSCSGLFNARQRTKLTINYMMACNKKFISFAAFRELILTINFAARSFLKADLWSVVSTFSIITYQIIWIFCLLITGALWLQISAAITRARRKYLIIKQCQA